MKTPEKGVNSRRSLLKLRAQELHAFCLCYERKADHQKNSNSNFMTPFFYVVPAVKKIAVYYFSSLFAVANLQFETIIFITAMMKTFSLAI